MLKDPGMYVGATDAGSPVKQTTVLDALGGDLAYLDALLSDVDTGLCGARHRLLGPWAEEANKAGVDTREPNFAMEGISIAVDNLRARVFRIREHATALEVRV